jgi:hypothetical protein
MIANLFRRLLSKTSTAHWALLFPVTYFFHILEEYYGGEGYSAYLLRLREIHLSETRFLLVQTIGLTLMIVGIILARRLRFPNQLSVALGAVTLVNGLTHVILSLVYTEYVPGLITSLILWIPLGLATLVCLKPTMRESRYWLCLTVGVGINGIIELITTKSGQLF